MSDDADVDIKMCLLSLLTLHTMQHTCVHHHHVVNGVSDGKIQESYICVSLHFAFGFRKVSCC